MRFKVLLFSAAALFLLPACSEKNDKPDDPGKEEDLAPESVEAVDLGLSVKWASCNVGATAPEEFGDFYAWACTYTQSTYSWISYEYNKNHTINIPDIRILRYCHKDRENMWGGTGKPDGRMTLRKTDDAACVNWGGSWRTPTKAEMDELLKSCDWEWTEQNGVSGYLVSGKKSGFKDKSIFLPASGYMIYDVHLYEAMIEPVEAGSYWTSSLYEEPLDDKTEPMYAHSLFFQLKNDKHTLILGGRDRALGLTVRPVCD